ncbi:MAG: hypothetical protein BWX68_02360 [Verrucomicrobia bacterium ADurb.Bin063]|nr:MAG: hypothetical protein BWX68_02360 [Verrucomicrobia bacterium ADurb.Bin063]
MANVSKLWRCLEDLRGLVAVPAGWRARLGGEFEGVRGAFLRARPGAARSFPCPDGCGCYHEVVHHDDGRIVGVCRCESWNCDDIPLRGEDLVLLELNWPRLGRALAAAFGFEAKEAAFGVPGVMQIGSFGGGGLPIVLSVQHEPDEFRSALMELAVRLREGFVVLAPTGRWFDVRAKELLAGIRAGFFDLESNVALVPGGRLQASKRAGELFVRFLPERAEAADESDAKRVFELFRKLATDKGITKAPLETVFRLTVLEGHSQAKTARLCECAASLISRRVKTIESRCDMSIELLRNYASAILEMEASVKGDKPRKKKYGAPRDEPDEYDGGAGGPDLVEDDNGYLLEERPESGC